jgi:hypothetical protein
LDAIQQSAFDGTVDPRLRAGVDNAALITATSRSSDVDPEFG